MAAKIYDLVKELLTDYPELRDSDKKLIWRVWEELQLVESSEINGWVESWIFKDNFLKAPSTESIRRCRQKIQELHPELRGSERINKFRQSRASEKGTFIFREEFKTNSDGNLVMF